jgi:YHYH protein
MRRVGRLAVPLAAVALVLAGCGSDASTASTSSSTTTTTTAKTSTSTWPTTDLVLDTSADYGDKYADGILPVGDGKLVLDGPEQGSVFLCNEGGEGGGATARGPWFVNDDTEYDLSLKIHVEGDIDWNGEYSSTIDGDERLISTNAVPDDHPTGQFPVATDDPAYQYDHNPNTITEQTLDYRVSALPTLLDEPHCMGGEAGVMTTGVALFNAFDAGNRDAGAWEIQDGCDGHPEVTGEYHYHTLSTCIDDVGATTLIGWALDGFPITGPRVGDGNILTTSDLDECHGITGPVVIDGETVTTYHYVMTQDFPYSISCFRATPADPPGRGVGGPPGQPG